MTVEIKHSLVVVTTFCLLGALLFGAFYAVDAWAAGAFARPMMGAALVSVIQVGLLLVCLMLAPPLSSLLYRVVKMQREEAKATD
jgi:uncharacterized membrane protein